MPGSSVRTSRFGQEAHARHAAGRRLRIFTWHVHGSYLLSLAHVPHDFFVPVKPGRPEGYTGKSGPFPWPENVQEIPAEQVRRSSFDCILYQSRTNYVTDQYELLSASQRDLPQIYLEHEPPRDHPVDELHFVDDPNVLVVHVTPFNALMWNSGRSGTMLIEHGVPVPQEARYRGDLPRGLVAVNNLASRGRRLGVDVFFQVRSEVPLDLIGMGSEEVGGLGEIPHDRLPRFACRYRFLFNPIRYTSLGFAVIEAMLLGMPIIGLATTEMATAIENGVSGFVDTNVDRLILRMRELLQDPAEAKRLGDGARRRARERFGIERFVRDWLEAFARVTDGSAAEPVRVGVRGGGDPR
jgi:glycosyltransferase involved in cell wall biosynthesis